MFAPLVSALIVASSLLVRADVTPTAPAPGDSFNTGTNCHIAWTGDDSGDATWKTTFIELMAGSNFDMQHITTVATVDGTVTGVHDFPCPDVTPNSAIYFYQFSNPITSTKQWTGRFIIASTTGNSVPPANAIQPGSGEAKPWGTGALVNPADAVAAPPSGGSNSSAPASGPAGSAGPSASGPSTILPSAPPTSPSSAPSSIPSGFTRTPPANLANTTSSSSGAAPSNTTSAAIGGLVVDTRIGQAVAVICASALTFTMLL